MIKKTLVIGKQIFLITKLPADSGMDRATALTLLMPIEIYWDIREYLRQADYMIASSDEQAAIMEMYRKIFKKAAPYAVSEKDRDWLYSKAKV